MRQHVNMSTRDRLGSDKDCWKRTKLDTAKASRRNRDPPNRKWWQNSPQPIQPIVAVEGNVKCIGGFSAGLEKISSKVDTYLTLPLVYLRCYLWLLRVKYSVMLWMKITFFPLINQSIATHKLIKHTIYLEWSVKIQLNNETLSGMDYIPGIPDQNRYSVMVRELLNPGT